MEYDKICHFLASYALLVSFFAFMRRNKVPAASSLFVAFGLALSIGLFKEFVMDYTAETGDIIANIAGLGVGTFFTAFLF